MHGLKEIKDRCIEFKLKASFLSKEQRLEELIKLANFKPLFKKRISYTRRRKDANRRKKTFWKLPCFVCMASPPSIRHHMILIKHGGAGSKANTIPICNPCHAEIHPWLK